MNYALLSCTKSKAPFRCAAKDMYWPSALFRAAWRTATARAEMILIVSARYGVLVPSDVIEKYDETLLTKTTAERRAWGNKVAGELLQLMQSGDNVTSYVSSTYAAPTFPILRAAGITVAEPLEGLRSGERLRWLNQNSRGGLCTLDLQGV